MSFQTYKLTLEDWSLIYEITKYLNWRRNNMTSKYVITVVKWKKKLKCESFPPGKRVKIHLSGYCIYSASYL